MPYIKKEDRLFTVDAISPSKPGELNYFLSIIVDRYLVDKSAPSYTSYNEVIGVLECMKMELYRRFIAKYEDEKLAANGEVFFHDKQ